MRNKGKPTQPAAPLFARNGHRAPVTRRDFLSQGLLGLTASVMMPSALSVLLRANHALAADECPTVSPNGLLPFLVFDMAGGSAVAGNFIPLDGSGSFLPSYSRMGMGTAPTANSQFGAPMAGNGVSQILAGILATTTPAARANLRMGMLAHTSQDDTNTNMHSALLHVSRAGYQGTLVRSGLGTQNSRSGGNTDVPVFDPALKPLEIRSATDLANAVSYGTGLSSLAPSQLQAMARAVLRLSEGQAEKIKAMRLGDQLSLLARCGLTKNIEFTGTVTGIDPRLDPTFQGIYAINAGTGAGTRDVRVATVVMNVLSGNSGPGCITIGGCDYHDNTQTTGDAKDLEAGREIGRAVQAAFDKGRPLVFQLLTDGSVSSGDGNRVWTGDDGDKGMTVVGCVLPTGAPTLLRNQVGRFLSGQGADRRTLIGSDPKVASAAVLANYLQLCGRLSQFENLVDRQTLSPTSLDEVLLFS